MDVCGPHAFLFESAYSSSQPASTAAAANIPRGSGVGKENHPPLLTNQLKTTTTDVLDQKQMSVEGEEAQRQHRYYSEIERMKTFDKWGANWNIISPSDLSRWGFIATGTHCQVQCVFCKVIINHFSRGDSARDKHLSLSPNCPLLRDRETAEKINKPWSFPPIRTAVKVHYCSCWCGKTYGYS